MSGLLLRHQQARLGHQVEVPGDHRAVLGEIGGDGADIAAAVQHQELEDLGPGRVGQGLEHLGVKVLDQVVKDLWALGRVNEFHKTYISARTCTCQWGAEK